MARRSRKRLFAHVLAAAMFLSGAAVALDLTAVPSFAATGDHVGTVNFSVPCTSGVGVGIAYDGTNLWYSCFGRQLGDDADLFRAHPGTGVVDASYNIVTNHGLGALSYDATRNAIWAGAGSSQLVAGPIYRIDLDGGKNVLGSTLVFFTNDFCFIDDGLAFDARNVGDPTDDVLYYSDDCETTTIDVYPIAGGAPVESFPWGGITGIDCYNSGLAVGGQLLYQGSAGCNHVWVVDKGTKAPAFDFPTAVTGDPNSRGEDLECDTDTFAVDVMWSKEARNPRRAHAFEIPQGSCGVGGVTSIGVEKDCRFTNINFNPTDPGTGDPLPAELGAPLPHASHNDEFAVDVSVHSKKGTVLNTNPGQFYCVVSVLGKGLESFQYHEEYGDQFDVNPANLGGGVEVIVVDGAGFATVLTDILKDVLMVSWEVDNVDNNVWLDLDILGSLGRGLEADESLMIYTKFEPSPEFKGKLAPGLPDHWENRAFIDLDHDGKAEFEVHAAIHLQTK